MYWEFHDTEELSVALKHTDVRAVQISKGPFRAELDRICVREWSLQHLSFKQGTSACAGAGPSDRTALLIPISIVPGCRLLGKSVDETSLAVYAPGSEHGDLTHAGFKAVVIALPDQIPDYLTSDSLIWPSYGSQVISASPVGMTELRALLDRIVEIARTASNVFSQPEAQRRIFGRSDAHYSPGVTAHKWNGYGARPPKDAKVNGNAQGPGPYQRAPG